MMWNQWINSRKWLKTRIVIYFGAQIHLEIGPLRPILNTPLKLLKLTCKPRSMRNFYLFWGSKWPKSGPLRPISFTHLKVLAMRMWSNTDVKPLKTLFRKWPKSGILTFIGPKTPQIGPLWPIFHAPLKVLAMCMWSYTIYIYVILTVTDLDRVILPSPVVTNACHASPGGFARSAQDYYSEFPPNQCRGPNIKHQN